MEDLDRKIAEARRVHHEKIARQVNAHRRSRPPYAVGDYVWLLKPKGVTGPKLGTWWLGPYEVIGFASPNSYFVKVPREGTIDAHASQLKLCVWDQPTEPMARFRIPPEEEAQEQE